MPEFTQHTIESAAKASKQTLRAAERRYGFVPNLMAIMAESPALLKAYATIGDIFARSSLSPIEQQVVILTVSQLNECTYCMAAHSMAAKMVGLPEAELDALRDGRPLADPKLEALRAFASAVVQELGWVSEEEINAFLAAGFEREQVLDVVVGVAYKTLSNYTNHLAGTPLDSAFAAFAWEPPEKERTTRASEREFGTESVEAVLAESDVALFGDDVGKKGW